MAKPTPKPDLLRIYTNAYGEMQVDYEGRPLGILASSPYFGMEHFYADKRPSMFDRRTISLEILDMGPDYFKARPPYNTVSIADLIRVRHNNRVRYEEGRPLL